MIAHNQIYFGRKY